MKKENTLTFVTKVKEYIKGKNDIYPKELLSTFDYTTTGKNHCHPRINGILTKAMWALPETNYVELDIHLRRNGNPFNPDIVGFKNNDEYVLIVDFESPNSSDSRIPKKDVLSYYNWAKTMEKKPEYLIITSLPNNNSPKWELRYTGPHHYNYGFKGDREKIRKNPFRYWYNFYRRQFKEISDWKLFPITFANFNGNCLEIVDLK